MIKRINKILFILIMLFSFLIVPYKSEAKTLSDIQKELDKKQSEYNVKKKEQSNLNNNVKISKNQISSNQAAIKKAEEELIAAGKKIQDLDADIAKKNEEIKDLMKLIQVTDADNGYLEYIFNAEDLTDFIHRLTMVEELANYNEIKIKEMNKMIEESKQLQIDLKNKQVALNGQISDLNSKISKYNTDLSSLNEVIIDTESEIKTIRESIAYYKSKGCKDNQDINQCLGNNLPYDTAFWRPINRGYASSEWGGRIHPVYGTYKMHAGIDLAPGNNSGEENVYASASGKVAGIRIVNPSDSKCGGNYVIIHHNIKGVNYTTSYLHLKSVKVSLGQIVTKDTVVGIMGGNRYYSNLPGYTPWEGCSTGRHSHFEVAKGLNLSVGKNTYNPRTYVNFPSGGRTFTDRTTKY